MVLGPGREVVEDAPADSVEPILHSTRFVLVDGEGTIRGYYDGMEQPPVDVLGVYVFLPEARA